MQIRRKYLAALLVFTSLIGAGWYFLFYPEEPWIRYKFVALSDEINAMADYIEGQSTFIEFSCIADDVWVDKQAAPDAIHKELQNHCRSARIVMGYQTDNGSFFHLGSRTKWFNDYWIAVVRDPNLDAAPTCSRWRKLDPAEECIVRLADNWAIHYWNATFQNEDVQELAEDVAKSLSEQ